MDIPLDTILETERCILKCVSENDVECVWTASRVPGFTDGMLWEPAEKKEEIVQNIYSTIENWKKGDDYCFSVYTKEADECIGRVSIRIRPKEGEGVWDIGYWIHPEKQGQGFATEVARILVDWGFKTLGAKCIQSKHATWNEASGRVLQKCGMNHVGHLDCGFVKRGNEISEECYEITREEWGPSL